MKNKTEIKELNDLKPFQHGDEGTHFACKEMSEKYGGKVKCCGCTNHDCKPSSVSSEEEYEKK